MNEKILLYDFSAVIYSLMYSIGKSNLTDSKGNPTSIIYGLIQKMRAIQENIRQDITVFTCDTKYSIREELFPAYKEKRKQKKKEASPKEQQQYKDTYKQLVILQKKILPKLGFRNIFWQDGYEADDVIASICQGYPDNQIVIVSRDNDLWQLLTDRVMMYDNAKFQYYTRANFVQEWGVQPKDWGLIKCLSGCTSDEVPGIRGVGYSTACKYLRGKMTKGKVFERIEEQKKEVIKRNKPLVILPMEGIREFTLVQNKFNKKAFSSLVNLLEFNSIKQTINNYNFK